MSSNQFYSVISPIIGEIVLVQFTSRTDAFFDAVLLEYPYRAMMSYQDATKKRKIYNWSKVVPLNKDMVARVDDIDEKARIVQISIAHLDEQFKDSFTLLEIQEKLMVTFNENRILDHFIKSISVINQTDKNELWNTLIYYIDSQRRLFNEDNDDELTLWKYFTTNIDEMLDKWCEKVNIESKLYESIKTMYSKRFDIKYKYVSKIGIISPNGINVTKDILDKVLSLLKYKYTFNYDGTPYYLFESFSDDSSKTNHEELINELKKYSEIFIKVEYLAKEIS
jgi:translation initiation factor 2 alpha subunit (eIF-2alpha)